LLLGAELLLWHYTAARLTDVGRLMKTGKEKNHHAECSEVAAAPGRTGDLARYQFEHKLLLMRQPGMLLAFQPGLWHPAILTPRYTNNFCGIPERR